MHEISFEIIELEEQTYHPLIRSEFEGLEGYWWVIDTGASKSVFDESLIGYYTGDDNESVMATGLGKEVVQTNTATIAEFKLGGYNFGLLKVALIDFQHINDEYAKFSDKKILGLIGSDFLYPHHAILDFGTQKVSLLLKQIS